MTSRARSLLCLLLCFALGSLVFLATSCSSKRIIVNGIDERDANEIVVLLASKGITAYKIQEKSEGGGGGPKVVLWDIAVDPSQAVDAMAILDANGLPRRPSENLLQLFPSGGLVPSEEQEKIRYQAGLAEQIASTIRKIDGVIDADVILSFPKENPLNPQAPKGPITAAVYIKQNGILDNPNSQLISKIKRLVAASVSGLSYDNVTVIATRARFAEVSAKLGAKKAQAEIPYVKVWSVIIARDSLTLFQTIFFSFCLVILLLFLSTVWMFWKLFPMLRKRGGISNLFHMAPLVDPYTPPGQEEPKPEEAPEEHKEDEGPKPPKVQENVETL